MTEKTRIIATIGPSCYKLKTLKEMKKNGMDIARINTKHINEKKLAEIYPNIKEIKTKIMIDICNLNVFKWINNYHYDYLAVSFVSSADQIKKIKQLVNSKNVKIISKIENRKGIDHFDSILNESYGIMIARGDLSKNLSFEKIPVIQKKIIKKCRKKKKMVITATEMLLSLMHHKSPKNSEVADIANAVFDGSNALMLSEETAIGEYPALAVKVMNKIIREIERTKSWNGTHAK